MDGAGERLKGMSTEPEGPEWTTQTIVDATVRTDDGQWHRCRVRVGIVHLPHGSGRFVASQLIDDDRLVLLPPQSIATLMGALRRGLFTL